MKRHNRVLYKAKVTKAIVHYYAILKFATQVTAKEAQCPQTRLYLKKKDYHKWLKDLTDKAKKVEKLNNGSVLTKAELPKAPKESLKDICLAIHIDRELSNGNMVQLSQPHRFLRDNNEWAENLTNIHTPAPWSKRTPKRKLVDIVNKYNRDQAGSN